MNPVIVIGAGGHAKMVAATLIRQRRQLIGLVDTDISLHGSLLMGIPVKGSDDWVLSYSPASVDLALGIGSVHRPLSRMVVWSAFTDKGYVFSSVMDPSAIVGAEVVLGKGVQILPRAVVNPGTVLGDNVLINTGAIVEHDCQLGDHCHVAPGATVLGGVVMGQASHVGAGAVVLQGLRVGDGVVIGAGAVVVHDVPDKAVVVGVPAHDISP